MSSADPSPRRITDLCKGLRPEPLPWKGFRQPDPNRNAVPYRPAFYELLQLQLGQRRIKAVLTGYQLLVRAALDDRAS